MVCKDCGKVFVITEEEGNWYKEKGFELPKRCPECRKARRKKASDKNDNTKV